METKTYVEKIVPRKCSATNRVIPPSDHASVQITVPGVDENGVLIGDKLVATYILSGEVRKRGESDVSVNRLLTTDNLVKGVYKY